MIKARFNVLPARSLLAAAISACFLTEERHPSGCEVIQTNPLILGLTIIFYLIILEMLTIASAYSKLND